MMGINRNIVECKGMSSSSSPDSCSGINRNIVECKDSWANQVRVMQLQVLIET